MIIFYKWYKHKKILIDIIRVILMKQKSKEYFINVNKQ
jgi:hypothetical protein